MEINVSLNTVKSLLGKRPIAQYNYQAKMKRKASSDKTKETMRKRKHYAKEGYV